MRDELMGAVERVAGMDDLDAKTRAIGELLRDIQAAEPAATKLRAEIVREQYADGKGKTFKEIGELLGVHWSTVQQIYYGKQTGRKRRTPEG